MSALPENMPEGYEPVSATVYPLPTKGQKPPAEFVCLNAETIMQTTYPELKWIVPGLVPEGLALLAGRQKLGKSWAALDWAVAVATGGVAFGSKACAQGDVLYVDMENGERRVKDRLTTLCPPGPHQPNLRRLEFVTVAPALNAGFLDALDSWRRACPNPRLVVIDVLQRIKPTGNAARNSYENDYAALAPLQQWATNNAVGVVALMHTRKGGADDPLEAVSGSNGQSACADTTLVLDKRAEGTTLYVRGRDVEESETALRFTDGHWTIIGDAGAVRLTDERRAILELLFEASEAMSPTDIAGALGKTIGATKKMLFTMVKAGELVKEGRGRYRHPSPNLPDDDESEGGE
jgi:hypothetical protein